MSFVKKLLAKPRSIPLPVSSLGIACLLIPVVSVAAIAASVQISAEETLNLFFLSDDPIPGATAQEHENRLLLRETVTQWLGSYEGVQPEAEHYRVLFEQGSIPVSVQFRKDGDPASITVVDCPVTSIPISQAPTQYREVLSTDCPNLTP